MSVHRSSPSAFPCAVSTVGRRFDVTPHRLLMFGLMSALLLGAGGSHLLSAQESAAERTSNEANATDPAALERFEREVRPVFAAKCAECHTTGSAEGGLALDGRQGLLQGGDNGPAIDLENPDASLLLAAIRRDGDLAMPPDAPLRAAEIDAIAAWIADGAPWPNESTHAPVRSGFAITEADRNHWAFRPVDDPPVPSIGDATSVVNDIDRFVQAKLVERGLLPAPRADRRTLLRRLHFDLVGLPPTPAEVDAFVADPRDDDTVLSEAIDRLLASPAYAERWGRHWLDVARYADTKDGVLMFGDDRVRPYAYTYRDYVVRAFAEDLPYDRFVVDQLAADLVEPAQEPWHLGALGLLTLGRMYDNNVHDVIDDQIDVVSRGFLGLTLACTRCHDHKSEPLSTADYYALYGVFANCEVPLELPRTDTAELSPETQEFERQAAEKRQAIESFLSEQFELLSRTARERTPDYLVKGATTPPDPIETAIFFLSLSPDELRPPIMGRWRKLIADRSSPDDPVFGLWVELMADVDAAGTTESSDPAEAQRTLRERLAATIERRSAALGTEPGQTNPLLVDSFREWLASPPSTIDRAEVARRFGQLLVEVDAQSRTEGFVPPDDERAAREQLLVLLDGPDAPAYFPRSRTSKFMSRAEVDRFGGMLTELDRFATQNPQAAPRAMVVRDREAIVEPKIFVRGNPSNPGAPVERRFPTLLGGDASKRFVQGSGRLELARAIVDPSNPLTDRVWVNRVWMHHFGEALVTSPSDFGTRTERPVHAELLDHLVSAFRRDGRSLKALHRRILMSHTWRQDSTGDTRTVELASTIDPDLSLLWKSRRRRLDFETMRDATLAVAGRLETRGGGRPVDLSADPSAPVRTLYGLVDRQNLPGMFRAFDFASPDVSVERRPRTMVAQQALFALNSPFMISQAQSLAGRCAPEADDAARVRELVRAVWLREPTDVETRRMLDYLALPADAGTTLAPFDRLALALLASNEWMYVD